MTTCDACVRLKYPALFHRLFEFNAPFDGELEFNQCNNLVSCNFFHALYLPMALVLSMGSREKNEPYHIMIPSYTFPITDSKFRNIYLITAIVIVRCLFHHSRRKNNELWHEIICTLKEEKKAVRTIHIEIPTEFESTVEILLFECITTSSHVDSIKNTMPLNRQTHKPEIDDTDTMRVFDVWKFFTLLLLQPL